MMLYKAISLVLVTGFCSGSFFQKQEDRAVQNTNGQEDDILRIRSGGALRSRDIGQRSSDLVKKDENYVTQEELQEVDDRLTTNIAAVSALLDNFIYDINAVIYDINADMKKLWSESDNQEAAIAKLQEMPVHFYAYETTMIEPGENQILKLNHVMSNFQSGYDPQTGKFKCPVSGLYHFNYYVFGKYLVKINWGGTIHVAAILMKDSVTINGAESQVYLPGKQDNDWMDMNGANSAVLHCNEGEQLWLVSPRGGNRIDQMNFSGYLIYET